MKCSYYTQGERGGGDICNMKIQAFFMWNKKKRQIKLLLFVYVKPTKKSVLPSYFVVSLNHDHMKNKSIMLKFFISKGMLDLEFF